jgi:hypothetical protein
VHCMRNESNSSPWYTAGLTCADHAPTAHKQARNAVCFCKVEHTAHCSILHHRWVTRLTLCMVNCLVSAHVQVVVVAGAGAAGVAGHVAGVAGAGEKSLRRR